jgi:predicted nucleic acid-binding protein
MLASALASQCKYLLSEDMKNGQIIEKSLTIINPFALSK